MSGIHGGRTLQVIEDLVPQEMHADAWKACLRKRWYFGQTSMDGGMRFWKMDLEKDPAFDRIWESARARCEELAGMPLRVVRQYANGQTYGLGGASHQDDDRPGCYTLLYYPMEHWEEAWEGETVFYDQHGGIKLAVVPQPNKAVFFDSRIHHVGRAPSRDCAELRVTVAYKLEAAVWDDLRSQLPR